ncbi:HXXXD-type acyl-transferase family protein [Striga hermonthica]|uniref:HXXXD-type acyl-transferase family protein n=1 Tax=Striga hermonthica TaxID=68872 RepID=A0A9N7RK93_STRHE|nr:HXXXD-type acyl-transferase family protein [Striga hermonthica]
MDVHIISVDTIKPSSPAPNHLTDVKLCSLDHLIPADYAPVIFFYPDQNNSKLLHNLPLLKQSLSQTLSRFSPLAGTIKDDLSIVCDDRGARFVTAKAENLLLGDFLESPDLKVIAKLLPCGPVRKSADCVANIQVTEFECGGVSIGVCVSHKILDGVGLSTFLRSWACSASSPEEKNPARPDLSAPSIFPAADVSLRDSSMAMWGSLMREGRFVTRRFVFDGSRIEILKELAAAGSTRDRPTRIEAVSGFIWKCAAAASEERFGHKRPSFVTHLVNLRKRASPNLPQESFGNLLWLASAQNTRVVNENVEFSELVGEVRKSISRIDGDFVKEMQCGEGLKFMRTCLEEIRKLGSEDHVDHYGFSSWCKLGFYDVDFGWGRPVWVSSIDASGPFFMNLIILVDRRFDDGIEAWVTLDEEEMAILEELLFLALAVRFLGCVETLPEANHSFTSYSTFLTSLLSYKVLNHHARAFGLLEHHNQAHNHLPELLSVLVVLIELQTHDHLLELVP